MLYRQEADLLLDVSTLASTCVLSCSLHFQHQGVLRAPHTQRTGFLCFSKAAVYHSAVVLTDDVLPHITECVLAGVCYNRGGHHGADSLLLRSILLLGSLSLCCLLLPSWLHHILCLHRAFLYSHEMFTNRLNGEDVDRQLECPIR